MQALQEKISKTPEVQQLINAYFDLKPSPQQRVWLSSHPEIHAMIDILGGLNFYLKKLIKKGTEVKVNHIPRSNFFYNLCLKERWNFVRLALTGGKDYCLIVTDNSGAFESIQYAFQHSFSHPLFPIGRITNCKYALVYE